MDRQNKLYDHDQQDDDLWRANIIETV